MNVAWKGMKLRAWLASCFLAVFSIQGCLCMDSCMVGDTEVDTPSGPLRVDSLRQGDLVWAVDVATGTRHARAIQRITSGWSRHIMRPSVQGRRMHGLTPTHPVHDLQARAFRPAGQLVPGSVVMTGEFQPARVDDIQDEGPMLLPVRVYDLSLDGPEHAFLADGVVVHNKSTEFPYLAFRDVALCTCVAGAAGSDLSVAPACQEDAGGALDDDYPCCRVFVDISRPITTVDCASRGVRSLAMPGSGYAQALEATTWNLAGNAVTTLAASAVPRAASVDLTGNPITDIASFAASYACKHDTRITLAGTQLTSEDNPYILQLEERGCVVTPRSF